MTGVHLTIHGILTTAILSNIYSDSIVEIDILGGGRGSPPVFTLTYAVS